MQTGRQRGRQIDGQRGRQTGRQTDRQTDRQALPRVFAALGCQDGFVNCGPDAKVLKDALGIVSLIKRKKKMTLLY